MRRLRADVVGVLHEMKPQWLHVLSDNRTGRINIYAVDVGLGMPDGLQDIKQERYALDRRLNLYHITCVSLWRSPFPPVVVDGGRHVMLGVSAPLRLI